MRFGGFAAVVVGMFVLSLSTGCQNTGSPSSEKAVSSLVETRVEVVKAQNDLTETLMSLDGLQNATGDVRPAYDRFKKALAAVDEDKAAAEKRANAMRENSAEYQKKWEEEVSVINDPSVKTSAQERVQHVRDGYGEIRDIALDCRKQYATLHTDLLDINRYLENDLNASAIEKIKPNIMTARKDGDALNSRLGDLVAKMNELTAQMNPTGKVPERGSY
jgi:predicted  nucleic acid-binding Zn-ribbon protein